jgi:galactokinase/mevalonate kinase-like predicted kinase
MENEMWDYLILTAGNDMQAAAFRKLLGLRNRLGLIPDVKNILVVPDTRGKRIGSGGSTLLCLLAVLNHQEQSGLKPSGRYYARYGASIFSNLRILIIHAGGDSKRVPAYGSCGKIFVPIPGESDQALPLSIFDRLLPIYLTLPLHAGGKGQVVVASGDVLLFFDAEKVHFDHAGITGLGCEAAPETAKNHGVICADPGGRVLTYLQKPSVEEQAEKSAIDHAGQSVLDIGVFSFDGPTAAELVELCGAGRTGSGKWSWDGEFGRDIEESGLDFYREITSAMGRETTWPDYSKSVRRAGSRLSTDSLRRIYRSLRKIPFFLSLLPRCDFLHFGTSRQLIAGGNELLAGNRRMARHPACLNINNGISENGKIIGSDSWIEGCRVRASLTLGGENVVAGVDVDTPVSLPPGTVLDILKGKARKGKDALFVRCYGIDDGIRQTEDRGALFLNRPIGEWLKLMEARAEDVWPAEIGPKDRKIWNGRFFPVVTRPGDYEKWLWMLEPEKASDAQKKAWRSAPRSSFEETARRASLDDFHARRLENRAEEISGNVPRLFDPRSKFSADELVHVLLHLRPEKRALWPAVIIKEAHRQSGKKFRSPGMENLAVSRVLHSLGSAVQSLDGRKGFRVKKLLRGAEASLSAEEKAWLESLKIPALSSGSAAAWAQAARDAAFENVGRTIVLSSAPAEDHPRSALRSDEIIWGRAPARLDLGGGWSDTPPYSLEHGGCVINAAVNLNGQPPIQVYARVTGDLTIKVYSIDHGAGITIRTLEELLDYRKPTSQFGLARAALALSGFSLETAAWPRGTRTLRDMLKRYGGGIELTTLAAIPSGSGLGTSSIMGAALTAVVHRMMGRTLSPRELFHRVLQLEQELTTGGGWQDQIGGVLPGVKVITTDPGLIPNPRIHYITPDVLDPGVNKGQTLLYYTGLRRLAKNILRNVVGKYLDRDRRAMRTLRALHAFPPLMSEAMAGKDMKRFGELIERAWNLNKQIDPDSTTDIIESVLKKIGPLMHGAKLLGAGGGGFLLIVAKSPGDAEEVRARLESDPPNERARFFEYDISGKGLSVTVC